MFSTAPPDSPTGASRRESIVDDEEYHDLPSDSGEMVLRPAAVKDSIRERVFAMPAEHRNMVDAYLIFPYENDTSYLTPYHMQGNVEFNQPENIAVRQDLRNHPELLEAIVFYWDTFSKETIENGEGLIEDVIPKEQYFEVYFKMYKAMYSVFDEKVVQKNCEKDFVRDSKGKKYLTEADLQDCLFEIADIWTNSLDFVEYLEFLLKLFLRITVEVDPGGGTRPDTSGGDWEAEEARMRAETEKRQAEMAKRLRDEDIEREKAHLEELERRKQAEAELDAVRQAAEDARSRADREKRRKQQNTLAMEQERQILERQREAAEARRAKRDLMMAEKLAALARLEAEQLAAEAAARAEADMLAGPGDAGDMSFDWAPTEDIEPEIPMEHASEEQLEAQLREEQAAGEAGDQTVSEVVESLDKQKEIVKEMKLAMLIRKHIRNGGVKKALQELTSVQAAKDPTIPARPSSKAGKKKKKAKLGKKKKPKTPSRKKKKRANSKKVAKQTDGEEEEEDTSDDDDDDSPIPSEIKSRGGLDFSIDPSLAVEDSRAALEQMTGRSQSAPDGDTSRSNKEGEPDAFAASAASKDTLMKGGRKLGGGRVKKKNSVKTALQLRKETEALDKKARDQRKRKEQEAKEAKNVALREKLESDRLERLHQERLVQEERMRKQKDKDAERKKKQEAANKIKQDKLGSLEEARAEKLAESIRRRTETEADQARRMAEVEQRKIEAEATKERRRATLKKKMEDMKTKRLTERALAAELEAQQNKYEYDASAEVEISGLHVEKPITPRPVRPASSSKHSRAPSAKRSHTPTLQPSSGLLSPTSAGSAAVTPRRKPLSRRPSQVPPSQEELDAVVIPPGLTEDEARAYAMKRALERRAMKAKVAAAQGPSDAELQPTHMVDADLLNLEFEAEVDLSMMSVVAGSDDDGKKASASTGGGSGQASGALSPSHEEKQKRLSRRQTAKEKQLKDAFKQNLLEKQDEDRMLRRAAAAKAEASREQEEKAKQEEEERLENIMFKIRDEEIAQRRDGHAKAKQEREQERERRRAERVAAKEEKQAAKAKRKEERHEAKERYLMRKSEIARSKELDEGEESDATSSASAADASVSDMHSESDSSDSDSSAAEEGGGIARDPADVAATSQTLTFLSDLMEAQEDKTKPLPEPPAVTAATVGDDLSSSESESDREGGGEMVVAASDSSASSSSDSSTSDSSSDSDSDSDSSADGRGSTATPMARAEDLNALSDTEARRVDEEERGLLQVRINEEERLRIEREAEAKIQAELEAHAAETRRAELKEEEARVRAEEAEAERQAKAAAEAQAQAEAEAAAAAAEAALDAEVAAELAAAEADAEEARLQLLQAEEDDMAALKAKKAKRASQAMEKRRSIQIEDRNRERRRTRKLADEERKRKELEEVQQREQQEMDRLQALEAHQLGDAGSSDSESGVEATPAVAESELSSPAPPAAEEPEPQQEQSSPDVQSRGLVFMPISPSGDATPTQMDPATPVVKSQVIRAGESITLSEDEGSGGDGDDGPGQTGGQGGEGEVLLVDDGAAALLSDSLAVEAEHEDEPSEDFSSSGSEEEEQVQPSNRQMLVNKKKELTGMLREFAEMKLQMIDAWKKKKAETDHRARKQEYGKPQRLISISEQRRDDNIRRIEGGKKMKVALRKQTEALKTQAIYDDNAKRDAVMRMRQNYALHRMMYKDAKHDHDSRLRERGKMDEHDAMIQKHEFLELKSPETVARTQRRLWEAPVRGLGGTAVVEHQISFSPHKNLQFSASSAAILAPAGKSSLLQKEQKERPRMVKRSSSTTKVKPPPPSQSWQDLTPAKPSALTSPAALAAHQRQVEHFQNKRQWLERAQQEARSTRKRTRKSMTAAMNSLKKINGMEPTLHSNAGSTQKLKARSRPSSPMKTKPKSRLKSRTVEPEAIGASFSKKNAVSVLPTHSKNRYKNGLLTRAISTPMLPMLDKALVKLMSKLEAGHDPFVSPDASVPVAIYDHEERVETMVALLKAPFNLLSQREKTRHNRAKGATRKKMDASTTQHRMYNAHYGQDASILSTDAAAKKVPPEDPFERNNMDSNERALVRQLLGEAGLLQLKDMDHAERDMVLRQLQHQHKLYLRHAQEDAEALKRASYTREVYEIKDQYLSSDSEFMQRPLRVDRRHKLTHQEQFESVTKMKHQREPVINVSIQPGMFSPYKQHSNTIKSQLHAHRPNLGKQTILTSDAARRIVHERMYQHK